MDIIYNNRNRRLSLTLIYSIKLLDHLIEPCLACAWCMVYYDRFIWYHSCLDGLYRHFWGSMKQRVMKIFNINIYWSNTMHISVNDNYLCKTYKITVALWRSVGELVRSVPIPTYHLHCIDIRVCTKIPIIRHNTVQYGETR